MGNIGDCPIKIFGVHPEIFLGQSIDNRGTTLKQISEKIRVTQIEKTTLGNIGDCLIKIFGVYPEKKFSAKLID